MHKSMLPEKNGMWGEHVSCFGKLYVFDDHSEGKIKRLWLFRPDQISSKDQGDIKPQLESRVSPTWHSLVMYLHAPLALALILLIVLYAVLLRRKTAHTPPIVHISEEAMFKYPREAYESALKQHGSVIGVYRKNRLEYIVDESHAAEVLTNDVMFSAERGTAALLNLPILNALPYSLIGTLDKLVVKGITPIVERLVNT
ncbi:hypothetical protein H0H93_013159, partial [Arthromyces matolae]